MRALTLLALAAPALGALAVPAAAFPLPQAPQVATVQTVAGGCGVGFHRGPWGGCRGNGAVYVAPHAVVVAPRPVVVAPGPVVVAPVRHCWWRAGPYGSVRVCN
ncbi:hypothetical protein GGQ86_002020 [Xanthobacter flavus]|uniref:Uncharacterized protein n=1 Tax=Xanthobacter flavus TaxID=281 RepID=A0A9W6CEA3_XANFL|nr:MULTISPECIES: hypothetical protein [Xanthobacter]MDR6333550.1 hypothetical protein [Xanthobacter flavus]UDQ90643.1 hypothetical protein LJE71_06465 [Xanthobacter autotrophicus]GLI20698.1 hypothetical protein XFLAVUS301_03720 [Xanthobacter flavus]